MNDRLREFGQLLHAQRISIETAITRFAEADVEQRFVRAFERGFRRQARQLGHQPHEMHRAHLRDERIALRHVADQRSDLFRVGADVLAEDVGGAGRRRMKAEQRVNQRGLAGAVRPEQADRASAQFAVAGRLRIGARRRENLQINHRGVMTREGIAVRLRIDTDCGAVMSFFCRSARIV